MSWYKVERGWLDNPFFQDSPYSERDAWQWMIGEAAFEECRISVNGKPFALGKGQLYSSIRFMAQKFQWSTGRVARFLERLKEWGMVDTAVDTGQNLITICNYAKYQDRKTNTDTPVETAVDTPSDTAAEHQRIQTISPSIPSSTKEKSLEVADAPPKHKAEKGMRLEAYLEQNGIETVCQEFGKWSLQAGMTAEQINWEMQKFRDWWKAAPASKGVKLDWPATWRTWCRSFLEKQQEQERRNAVFKNRK